MVATLFTTSLQPTAAGSSPNRVGLARSGSGDRIQTVMQHDFAMEVVPDLDFFLVFVGHVVGLVVVLRLEEKVAELPRRHRHQPGQQYRARRFDGAARTRR